MKSSVGEETKKAEEGNRGTNITRASTIDEESSRHICEHSDSVTTEEECSSSGRVSGGEQRDARAQAIACIPCVVDTLPPVTRNAPLSVTSSV
jgi:hypothetical protein